MNYQETLSYLFSQLPMYQRIGKAAYKANLDNTLALDSHFGHPHKNFKTIHVAGTNGKGSTSHMLASVLMETGYKVGLYTSPHLKDFRERIRVNGEMISETYVVRFVDNNRTVFEQIKPSFFEMTVALAFAYFAEQKVDVAVVEVGLGGRLDSTNIISPELCIITNIGIDHTDLLGDTLEKIATEKAGIIKQKAPVVISQYQPEVKKVFTRRAIELAASIVFSDRILLVKSQKLVNPNLQEIEVEDSRTGATTTYSIDLAGVYQANNLTGVLVALQILAEQGFIIHDKNIATGLRNVKENTGLMGRWQTLSENPLVIVDTGHNIDGIKQVVKQIELTPYSHLHFVLGMVGDKDIIGVISLLPKNATYYFTKASIPRALNEQKLAEIAKKCNLNGNTYPTVQDAIAEAKKNANTNDLIFIGGSTFTVADALMD
jgi:dihydrofolate synthase/folylpolyglutamate synthase